MKTLKRIKAGHLIILFFLLRLYGITNPPLERNHNWRQATTNMYARNFLEVDNNILYARVDMAGDLTGITAKEFPLFNYSIYLTARAFGWQHWYGRLINLIISSLGVWFFYLILKKYLEPRLPHLGNLAFYSTIFLLAGIWFGHSRAILPDTFSTSLVLIGLFYGLEYLYQGRWYQLLLFFLLATAGVLSKLPSGFLLTALCLPVFGREVPLKRTLALAAPAGLMLAMAGWWYFYWIPHVVSTYGYEHYPMRDLLTGLREILSDLPETAERFYVSSTKGFTYFALYLAGLVLLFRRKNRLLLRLWLVLSFVFLFYMFKAGASFYHHNYYIVPFAPVMALVASVAICHIRKVKWRVLLLLVVLAEGIGNQQDAFRIRDDEKPKLSLETIADSLSQRQDLVAFFTDDGNPQELYFAHRKGWVSNRAELLNPDYIELLRSKGCRLIFINRRQWADEHPPGLPLVYEDENYWVFGLGNEKVAPSQ
ncbi:MAG: hypothetical protein Kow0027_09550 [Saprospiraceae bacterium]